MDYLIDDYAQYLSEQGRSPIAIAHSFQMAWNPEEQILSVFFEGYEDPIYLVPELRRKFPKFDIDVYVCNGKKSVRDTRDIIAANEAEGYKNCLFFVDRDFDDLLGCQIEACNRMYITDNYSIENDIVGRELLEIILTDHLGLRRQDPLRHEILGTYSRLENEFIGKTRLIVAWIITSKSEGLKPNLSNLNGLQDVVRISADGVARCQGAFDTLKRRCIGPNQTPGCGGLRRWYREICEIECADAWMRGKFKSWFFRKAVNRILEDASAARVAAGGAKLRIPNSLREGKLFELAAGSISPADTLAAFLQGHGAKT